MPSRRADLVALVIFERIESLFGDPYYSRLVNGFADALALRDTGFAMLMAQGPGDAKRIVQLAARGKLDGVALCAVPGSHPLAEQLASTGIPLVFAGRPADPGRFTYVDIDQVGASAHAVAHLVEGGRRVIATITGRRDLLAAEDRVCGYLQGLEAAGLPADSELIESGSFTRDGGAHAMQCLLRRRPQLDAVFVASDLMALGALEILAQEGRKVPEDVAVASFDDHPFAVTLHPPLTSVRQPIEDQGREMARLLFGLISAPVQPPRKVILNSRLEVRGSSAPAPGRVARAS
jgi:DNA-binding LacI/PurR family transcriptional regulator